MRRTRALGVVVALLGAAMRVAGCSGSPGADRFEADDATGRVTLAGGAPNTYLTKYVATLSVGTPLSASSRLVIPRARDVSSEVLQ